ncbi:MAG: Ribonuclease E [Alphaproteobacteria bacterium MarineAlpha5_Bin9]|nr:MAG: Ribonuclease E [Alphaproteobacteria bacterium MarineAlpha5_Bin9]|tara:strand:+ start:19529 stop:21340 length:1812 start_codon:yes stop_codon:yes gene_type:complete
MQKNILIDSSSSEQIRYALTLDGKLDDFEIEKTKKTAAKGDLFLAKISRVEPSLQAAFVDYGANRHGFLPLTEIHPDYFKIPVSDQDSLKKLYAEIHEDENNIEKIHLDEPEEDSTENKKDPYINNKRRYLNFFKKYKIQEVIKSRQVILVQINKEERGLKGAALTTFLSFAGRYCVLMPNTLNNNGISRKISDIEERKKIKQILETIKIPENMAVIVRTAGIGKTKKEITKDLDYLISQWNSIRKKTLKSTAPCIIHEEGNIINRVVRDVLTNDIDQMIIEGKNEYENTKKFAKKIVPSLIKKIKLYKDTERTLFNEKNIENQINELFSLKVNLKSGGSIVINATEALVAVDVNSGKNTFQRNIENTALNTNVEAAKEIARQMRLRDLAGLIVIDFIDMEDYRNNFKVEKTLKSSLNQDRARIQVGRISMFGLLELSRQRLRTSLIDLAFQRCNYCNGSGLIVNPDAVCDQILKVINEKLLNNINSDIQVRCNSSLGDILLNSKKDKIINIENKFNSKVIFKFDNNFSLHEPVINLVETNEKKLIENNKINSKKINLKNKDKRKIIKDKSVKKKTLKKIDEKDKIKEINDENDSQKSGWWAQ